MAHQMLSKEMASADACIQFPVECSRAIQSLGRELSSLAKGPLELSRQYGKSL